MAFFRQEKGLDQGALGKVINKSRQTINTWEGKVKVKMDQETALRLAKALGVDLKDLTDVKISVGTKTMDMDVWEVIKGSSKILELEFDRLWGLIDRLVPPQPQVNNKKETQTKAE